MKRGKETDADPALPHTTAFVYFRAQTETVKKLKRSDFDSQKGMEKIIIVLDDHQFFRAYNGKVKQYENRINCGKYKYTQIHDTKNIHQSIFHP